MKKGTWIILGIALLLGAVYFATKKDKISVGIKKIELPVFSKDSVDKIEIISKDKVLLEKNDTKWFIDMKTGDTVKKLPADTNNIDSLLEAILGLKNSYFVSERSEKLEELGLADDKKITIKIYQKDKLLWSLDIGKSGDNGTRYVKKPESPQIFAVIGSFWQITRTNPSDFRDKNIARIKEEDIKQFKWLYKGGLMLSLARDDDKGEILLASDQPGLGKDMRFKPSALSLLFKSVATLRAANFKDEPINLGEAQYEALIKDKAGHTTKIYFYPQADDKYLVKKDADNQIFEISKYGFDRINKSLEDLRDLSLTKFELGDVEGFTIGTKSSVVIGKKDGKFMLEQPKPPGDFLFDEEAVMEQLSSLQKLSALRVAKDTEQAVNKNWQAHPFIEIRLKDKKRINIYLGDILKNQDNYLIKGNTDDLIYIINKKDMVSFTRGLDAYRKNDIIPKVDENTEGFEGLPPDVQRKLKDAMQKQKAAQ